MDFQRVFIFLGLAVTGYFLILTWQQDYGANIATEEMPSISQEETTFGGSVPSTPAQSDSSIPELSTIPTMPLSAVSPATQVPSQPLISVETDVLRARINPVGGDIVAISLPAFPATLEQEDQPLRLVSDFNRYQLQSGLIGPDGIDKAGNRPIFQAAQVDYELGSHNELRVELTPNLDGANELSIQKEYVFRSGDYLVDVSYEIENRGSTPKTMAFFGQIKRDGQPPQEQDSNFMTLQPFIGGATRREDERYFKIDLEDLNEVPYQYDFTGGYIAFLQHYFLTAWVPFRDQTVRYFGKPAAGSAGFTPLVTPRHQSPSRQESGSSLVGSCIWGQRTNRDSRVSLRDSILRLTTASFGLSRNLCSLVLHGFLIGWGIGASPLSCSPSASRFCFTRCLRRALSPWLV